MAVSVENRSVCFVTTKKYSSEKIQDMLLDRLNKLDGALRTGADIAEVLEIAKSYQEIRKSAPDTVNVAQYDARYRANIDLLERIMEEVDP